MLILTATVVRCGGISRHGNRESANVKASYRGHEISVTRERCLAGYPILYYSIVRESDGYECMSGLEDSSETVRDKVRQLRERIDNELIEDDPWCEASGLSELYGF